ncbi:MAG: BON domain-containing protein [Gammaproteobacteria bacterium]|nr:BON domain-containing protein [Gammaproteobacteria bacterium]
MSLHGRQTTTLMVLLALLILGTGCQPLTSGAYAEQEERTLGEVTDDFNITSAVRARLLRDDEIRSRDISVETRRGVVTLFGHVATEQMERRALELARGLPNVVDVQSRLVVLQPEG